MEPSKNLPLESGGCNVSAPVISITDLEKDFVVDNTTHCVIKNLQLTIEKQSFVCILGYTGCGKSTLLRVICGLEKPNKGQIRVNGKEHTRPTKDVAMIFQDLNQIFFCKSASFWGRQLQSPDNRDEVSRLLTP